jgi:hypothetical protein
MSDLNWNKLPWRKSSFSSDSANCVEVSWTRSSACHQGSCVEVGWTASSLCAGGDCVQVRHDDDVYVRDSKLGDDSPVQEWPLTYWEFLCDAIVADLPRFSGFRKLDDGGVELRWAHIHPAPLIFDAGEWKAFVLGVRAGEFDPDRLTERFQSSSSRRGVAEEVREGSDSAAGPDQAATGAGGTSSPPAPVAAHEPLVDAAPGEDLVAEIPLGGAVSADGSEWRPSPAAGAGEAGAASSRPAPVAAQTLVPMTAGHAFFCYCAQCTSISVATSTNVPAGQHDEDPAPPLGDSSALSNPVAGQPGSPWHIGRAWSGHEIEDACPCEQEPCGLVATPDPSCVQHSRTKTIRQSHRADQCAALGAGITWSEDPSLGEPQGPPAGRPVDASTDEVTLSSAVQPGSDTAGTEVPPGPVPAAPEYGDLVMRQVEPRFIVDQAPERTLMSLGLLQSADERALFVAGGDTIYFGYDHESMGQFVYQVVGWDAERRGLILERISPASEAIDAELAKAAAPLVPAVETQETVS